MAIGQYSFYGIRPVLFGHGKETSRLRISFRDKYIVRFPDGMREKIADAAKESGRSMNAEIVARLESSFEATSPEEIIFAINRYEFLLQESEINRLGLRLRLALLADVADKQRKAIRKIFATKPGSLDAEAEEVLLAWESRIDAELNYDSEELLAEVRAATPKAKKLSAQLLEDAKKLRAGHKIQPPPPSTIATPIPSEHKLVRATNAVKPAPKKKSLQGRLKLGPKKDVPPE